MRPLLGLLGILGGVIPLTAAAVPAISADFAVSESSVTDPAAEPSAADDASSGEDDHPPEASFAERLVVTATLEQTPESELPSSITVIDAGEIAALQATTVLDLLRTVPGVAVMRSGGPGDVASVFTRGTSSTQTLVLWNGVPLNDPYFGGFDWAHLGSEGVERVEVVRGPLSTLYGSDAVGGVVQLITGTAPGARLSLEAGERGYARGALGAGIDRGPLDLDLDLAAAHAIDDGLLDNDDYTTSSALVEARREAREGFSLGLLARLQESELGIPRSGALLTPRRRQRAESLELAAPLSAVAGAWRFDALLSRTEASFRFRDPDAGFSSNDTDSERLRARLVAAYELDDARWLGAGGDWREETVTNVNTFGTNLDDAERSGWSAFAQLHASGERWSAEAALRRDEDDAFGGEWSPSAGLRWAPTEAASLRASYGEGFRAPSLGELFFPFSGNPDLAPESSRSVELGIDLRRGDWAIDLALFDQRVEDLIEFDLQTFTNVNRGETRSRGAELVVGWSRDELSARFAGTYLDAEDEATGLELLRRPRESASLSLGWRPAPWSWRLLVTHVGERADLDPATFARASNEPYTTIDLMVRWSRPRIEPYARLLNLADERYEEVLGFPAPGRTLIGGVALSL